MMSRSKLIFLCL
uniref:Uncharacterized protein n=1 Tax=Rhizophora mucronata TaxID=61149 RepID=A0A2P2JNI6_RHIMU